MVSRSSSGHAAPQTEQAYRRLIEALPIAVYTCDADGIITYFNEQAAALWGQRPVPGDTEHRFCGSYRLWRSDGTVLPHRETPMAAALRYGREFRNECVVIERPDGSRVTVMVNIDPLRNENGEIIGAVNAFHDVTPLELAERLGAEQRRLLEFVARGASTRECLSELCRAVRAIEPTARALVLIHGSDGNGANDAIGTDFLDLNRIGPMLIARAAATDQEIAPDIARDARWTPEAVSFWQRHGVKRITCVPVHVHTEAPRATAYLCFTGPLPLPRLEAQLVEMVRTVVATLFQRDHAARAQRDSEERFRTLFEQTTGGVAQCDLSGRFVLVNDRYCKIFGRTRDELMHLRMQDITHPDDREANLAQFRAIVEGHGDSFVVVKRYVRPNGEHVWVRNHVSATRDCEGRTRYVTAAVSEITDRKRAEEKLLRSEQELADFFDNATIVLHWVGPDGIILRVNKA